MLDLLAAAGAAQPPAWTNFIWIIGVFAIFWFLIIRPQMKRQKEHQERVGGLKKGDQVVTQGGLVGKVIKDNTIPPTKGADRGKVKKLMNTAKPNKPNTIEGTAARLLMLISMKSMNRFFGANSSR